MARVTRTGRPATLHKITVNDAHTTMAWSCNGCDDFTRIGPTGPAGLALMLDAWNAHVRAAHKTPPLPGRNTP